MRRTARVPRSPRLRGLQLATSAAAAAASLALALALAPAPAQAAQDTDSARIHRIQTRLAPAVVVVGREPRTFTLEQRMRRYDVPGVSVAVVDGGRIAWARGYGEAEAGSGRRVTPGTLFQAASISKPVAALAALRLVEQGRLELDSPVNEKLRSWQVPAHEFTYANPVTLRGLLTHSAGLTVHGFRGYAAGAGEAVPTVLQVLDGAAPANSAPIRVDIRPGSQWRYSGGGYTVMQLLLADVTGKPFPALVRELVLDPLGMRASTYEQPLPAARAPEAATAHRSDGEPVRGGWHTYPEMAAAGLWTTPTDLARYIIAVQKSFAAGSGAILSPELTRAMLTPHLNDWGLGPGIQGEGETLRFSHGGSNRGFKAFFVGFVTRGQGAAIMTNGDNGSPLAREILLAIAREYGWPDHAPRELTPVALPDDALREIAGTYRLRDLRIILEADGSRLTLRFGDGAPAELVPVSDAVFVSVDDGLTVRVQRGEQGVNALLLPFGRAVREGSD